MSCSVNENERHEFKDNNVISNAVNCALFNTSAIQSKWGMQWILYYCVINL